MPVNIDKVVENFLTAARNPLGVKIFTLISLLGKWEIILAVALLSGAVFWFSRFRNYTWPFWATVAGSQLSEFLLKRLVQRPRPLNGVHLEDSFSFPSGHAVVVMGFFGFLIYFAWRNVAHKFWRNALMFLGGLIILLVGFSRLYLGVHYLTDVLAGFVFGGLWLWLGIYWHQRSERSLKK